MEGFWFEAGAIIPSLGVGLLFWFAMRSILRADRREREAERLAEREYQIAREKEISSPSGSSPDSDPARD